MNVEAISNARSFLRSIGIFNGKKKSKPASDSGTNDIPPRKKKLRFIADKVFSGATLRRRSTVCSDIEDSPHENTSRQTLVTINDVPSTSSSASSPSP